MTAMAPLSSTTAEAREPTDPRRNALALFTAGLWVATCVILTLQYWGAKPTHIVELQLRRVAMCLFGAGLCWGMAVLLDRARRHAITRRALIAGVLSVVACVIYAWTNHYLFYVFRPWWGRQMSIWYLLDTCRVAFGSFLAWAAVYLAIASEREAAREHRDAVQTERLLAEARHRMLRYQLDPHFMFNTLNALSALILQGDGERAERMVLALSRFLRISLDQRQRDRIPLIEDVAALREYVAIEEVRFGDRLQFREALAPEVETALIPTLLFQPLVENAIKHGVARTTGAVTVAVAARREGETLVVSVEDDAQTTVAATVRLGIGLGNLEQRLEAAYPGRNRMTFGALHPHGFRVELRLPLDSRG